MLAMSVIRRIVQVVALIGALLIGVAAMAVIVTQTAWFKEWMRGFIVRQAADYVNGELSIGRLDGNLFFGVELEDIRIVMDDQTVVEIKDVGLDYNAFTFLTGNVVLDDIRINQPVIRVQKTADGWNILQLIRARTPDSPRGRRPITIGEIGLSDATVYVEEPPGERAVGTTGMLVPARIGRLDASLGVTSDQNALTIDLAHVSLRADEPYLGINALSGVITRTDGAVTLDDVSLRTEESTLRVDGVITRTDDGPRTVDVTASSDKFVVEEIARIVPALRGYAMQPAFELRAIGPLDGLAVEFNAREANFGNVTGDVVVDATAPDRRVAGTVSMVHFNIAPLLRPRPGRPAVTSDVTGEADIDLALPAGRRPLHGTYILRAGRAVVAGYDARDVVASGRIDGRVVRVKGAANAYGGRATAAGTVTFGPQLSLDLSGVAANVDLRNLPPVLRAPGVPGDLQLAYTLTGRGGIYTSDVRFDASTLAGASIAPGTTARITFGRGAPSYAAKGQVAGLDVQQVGRGFGIRALETDRWSSRINATFDVTGSGGGRYPLTLDATGTVVDSQLFGATFPKMDVTTRLAGGDAQVRAVGRFAGLDPAVITGDERVAGSVGGTVDIDTTIREYASRVTVDTFDASGRVNLTDSTVADLKIDRAEVEGTYANREGRLARFDIAGPDLTASGRGTIALNDTGASNLTTHIETPSLEPFGAMIGRPLTGGAIVDATVTGNARALKAEGTLQGSNIGYGENRALSLSSMFAVTMPDLMPHEAVVEAQSTATFLEVRGQSIREVTAETTYSKEKLEFNAVVQEGERQLAAEGDAILHPDHQEVHLTNLALRAEQIEWRTAPGSESAIRYANDRIAVEKLHLVSGDQRIEADGVIGSPDDVLRVRAENVDVAQLDRLMLGDERLAGRLNANGTVRGPLDSPRAAGEFTLTQGAFRQFTFESLSGTVDYVRRGLNIDVRLDQSPQAWLTAKGYAPLALFRPSTSSGRPEPVEGRRRPSDAPEGHEVPADGDAIELQISSSQVDLGVIQGFTTYVTNVTGVLQANVKVTGTGDDPHFDGVIDIRGGAFAIPDLGTAYTGFDTRVDLTTDAVTIREMQIVDEHQKIMTIGGTLAVHEREVGAVDVKVQSENFEVIDNDLADLKLDTDVRVTGELRAPRIEGFVEVETGFVDVGRVIEEAAADRYEVEPAPGEERPSIFDALEMNLGVAVPGNLVLRGNDLRPANAPIDIGDMNVTVGGIMQVRKDRGERPRLVGEVNTIRGSYTFQGRRFEIMRDGRIRFAGTEEIDPLIDLRARRIISGVEVFVRVQGSMREPEMSFSSSPPQDQADILSLIVFNVPTNELSEGQQISLAEHAGALAGGYIVSGLTRSIAEALELDELEIQAAAESGLGPTLSIGEQVGERLFVRIRQGFGAAEATEFILEYQIADFLRLQGAVAETAGGTQRVTFRRIERGGIDLIFFFSY